MQIGELKRSPAFRALTDRGGRADAPQPLTREQFQQTCEALIPQLGGYDSQPFNQFAQAIEQRFTKKGLPVHDADSGYLITVVKEPTDPDGNYTILAVKPDVSEGVGYKKVRMGEAEVHVPYLATHLRLTLPEVNKRTSYVTGKQELLIPDVVRIDRDRILTEEEVQAFGRKVFDVCQKTP